MQYWLFRMISYIALIFSAQLQAQSTEDIVAADKGVTSERGRDAAWYLDQHQRLSQAIAALKPQTPGKVDAYILVAGLDGDPVFQSESQETARVLSRRYNADGRTIWLAAGSPQGAAQGSPANINIALAAIAGKMDLSEDVLILYTTSHGNRKIGIVYQDGRQGFGMIAPRRLGQILNDLGIKRRLVMISACFSGEFIPFLASSDSIIITAASPVRTSFGCTPGNDWTFFGDALINNGLRTAAPLLDTATQATGLISQWEKQLDLQPSEPQISIGANSGLWLNDIEKSVPKEATKKVGKPAIESEAFTERKGKAPHSKAGSK